MSDAIKTKKITDLTENTALADTDLFQVGNAGTAVLRKVKWSSIMTAIKSKIASWLFDSLQTTDKTLPGAINEVNTKASKYSPVTLYNGKILASSTFGSFNTVTVSNLNLYAEIQFTVIIGDFLNMPVRVKSVNSFLDCVFSAYANSSYHGKMNVRINFSNNEISVSAAANAVAGWTYNYFYVTNVIGIRKA